MEAVYIHNTLEKKTILTLLPEAKIITNVENAICIKKLLFFGIIDTYVILLYNTAEFAVNSKAHYNHKWRNPI